MEPIITVKHVSKQFGTRNVLEDVNMNIYQGEIYGFLGENGAGKTTLMKILLNLLKPSVGEVLIRGEKIEREDFRYLSEIGSMIEYPVFYQELTAKENLKLHCAYQDMEAMDDKVDEMMEMTGIAASGDIRVKEFSLGMKQRLGIARAVVTQPKILILDEPVNGLDPVGIRDMRKLLADINKNWGITILISSHIVSEIETLADRVGILHSGRMIEECTVSGIADGTLEEHFLNKIGKGERR